MPYNSSMSAKRIDAKVLIARICLTLLILAVVVSVYMLVQKGTTAPKSTTESKRTVSGDIVASQQRVDTDNDGLEDWEEALWGTDAALADTDADGTPDGTEVREGRNPKKAGPNDAVTEEIRTLPQTVAAERSRITATPAERPLPANREPETAPTESPTEENPLRTFGNELGEAVKGPALSLDSQIAFWNKAAGNKKMDSDLLSGFKALADTYDRAADAMLSVSGPTEEAARIRTVLAKAYDAYADALRTIAMTPAGEYLDAAALHAYSEHTVSLGKAFVAVSDFLFEQRVPFTSGEPGAIFTFPR